MYFNLKKRYLPIYLASLFLTQNLYSQQNLKQKQPSAILPLDPAVRKGRMANGFTYFIRRNTTPEKRVVFYIVNKVGSVLENEDQRGLAHFLEHMNFNGTTHYPKNELISYLEKSGVTFGADLNAYTNFDETVYQLPLPSDDPELLKNGLQIMRDWAHGALLEPVEIDKERGVILEEKRMRSGFDQRLMEKSLPMYLNNSIYSRRVPIGSEEVLTTFKPAQIKSFYKKWYRPDLQALIVVGDIDAIQMEKSVRLIFSDLKNPVHEPSRPKISIPLTGKKQFLKYTDAEAPDTRIVISYKYRSPELRTAADYRAKMVTSLIDQLLAFRFNELNQRADLPYSQANITSGNYLDDLDVFNFNVTLKPNQAASGFKNAYTELERIRRYGFTAAELDRVKKAYLAGLKALVLEKNKNNSSNYVEEYVNYFLRQDAAPGIDTEYRLVTEFLPGISLTEVNSKIASFLSLPDQDIIVTGPKTTREELPDEATLGNWRNAVVKSNLSLYAENKISEGLMTEETLPGKTTGESAVADINTTIYKLSNGVRLVFKQTDFKNDGVLFYSYKSGGTSLASDQNYYSAVNATALVKAGGVAGLTATQLGKFLTGKKLSVSPYMNELYEGFSGSFGAEDIETALQLIRQYHIKPRKDTVIFKNIIANAQIAVANRHNDPEAVFSDTINAVLGNHSIRRMAPDAHTLSHIDLDKALAFYKERFHNVNGETFVFVGNFKWENLLKYCETYLGSLPSDTGSTSNFKDLHIVIPSGKATHIIVHGKEQKSEVKMIFSGDYDYSLVNNLQLQALGAILEFRLLERLRESEGGVYTPDAGATFAKYPSARYSIAINFTCAPQNADKLIKAALEEIENLKTNGILPLDLEKFKAETLRKNEVRVKTDGYWVSYLVRQLSNKEDLSEANQIKSAVSSLDRETLQKAAKKYMSGENLQQFILNPESL
ncbi:insulinase family protein [Mucilaginibacter rubeus]|uniref:Insulinase family protein n=1 Tax=Mucilaginibacter rubeus TaxID=2027860 RepID=A0AAE6JKC1_9SPHI|nr:MULTISPECIES: insulinase family protein [Mucilaginibacter]QEM07150.1 insulinase family protein [Mucilaginibacter rubeus]QEM19605.1 insulinase family protein [Mucilaginibacter gossypii]QTE43705.1 insulinase family protein [Mucilaginibacter rubeus]QTE50305.1 insulinase family protein [Mucilaginibacter rubeus]QTE55392.1 insulinase family protein [Mucilaginibacter rubeus]